MAESIWVVEDSPEEAKMLKELLDLKGYNTRVFPSSESLLTRLKGQSPPELFILDVRLEGLSGSELCEILRRQPRTSETPILMLTSLGGESHKVHGLKAGADDYVVKPFSHRELAARVEALLRRSKHALSPETVLEAEGVRINLDTREVHVAGRPVELRPKEFELLALLLRNRGRVLTWESLREHVWGEDRIATTETIRTQIKRLRENLGPAGENIRSVTGLGYKYAQE